MRDVLRAVPSETRAEWSAEIRRGMKDEDSWLPPAGGTLAMFGGMSSEPDLLPLLPWFTEHGVRAAFFVVAGEIMEPRVVRSASDLHGGQMGVLEPDISLCESVPLEKLDVVLLPGVAFNPQTGARLGRGKGHYDRVLDRLPHHCKRIGVCFHLALHQAVPLEAHDRHVQALVTEKGWRRVAD
jgi:5-formyltetrahydrofolate cyclo-ligase